MDVCECCFSVCCAYFFLRMPASFPSLCACECSFLCMFPDVCFFWTSASVVFLQAYACENCFLWILQMCWMMLSLDVWKCFLGMPLKWCCLRMSESVFSVCHWNDAVSGCLQMLFSLYASEMMLSLAACFPASECFFLLLLRNTSGSNILRRLLLAGGNSGVLSDLLYLTRL